MKTLIIEDDDGIAEAISIAFQMRWPEASVIHAATGEKGLDILEHNNIDLVILDLGLPGISGFETLKSIRLFSSVPVVILTVTSDESSIVKGLELGADEYLVKPIGQLELLARLKAFLRRQATINEDTMVCGPVRLEPSTAQVYCHGQEVELTPTEYRILYCLMKHAGCLVSYGDIVDTVWSCDYPGATAAIKVYIRRLRAKIESDPTHPEIIRTKPRMGLYVTKD